MVDRILAVAQVLGSHPWIGHAGRVAGTREFVVSRTPCVIVYSVNAELLTILRVLHSKQQWPSG
jgi:plasmid stabilization system protein ParE